MTAPSAAPGLQRLSLNQRTCANWSLREAIDGCARAGLDSLGVWREPVAEVGLETARTWIEDAGLRVSSVCRGGFLTGPEGPDRRAAVGSNRAAIEETAALRADTLVLVPGGLPEGDRDLPAARSRFLDGVAEIVPFAQEHGVLLAIEPMHPIFAADRGVISTLEQALDLAEQFPVDAVGVVVDTFHLWWEPDVQAQIARAAGRIASYQISDWITPLPPDALLSRGMMGEGHIDFATFTTWVAEAGYTGDIEVEIFNADIWAAPGDEVVATIIERYLDLVAPWAG